jgi:hypothetical protein
MAFIGTILRERLADGTTVPMVSGVPKISRAEPCVPS